MPVRCAGTGRNRYRHRSEPVPAPVGTGTGPVPVPVPVSVTYKLKPRSLALRASKLHVCPCHLKMHHSLYVYSACARRRHHFEWHAIPERCEGRETRIVAAEHTVRASEREKVYKCGTHALARFATARVRPRLYHYARGAKVSHKLQFGGGAICACKTHEDGVRVDGMEVASTCVSEEGVVSLGRSEDDAHGEWGSQKELAWGHGDLGSRS